MQYCTVLKVRCAKVHQEIIAAVFLFAEFFRFLGKYHIAACFYFIF